MHDEVKCSGQVLVETFNEANEVVDRRVLTNTVVRTGREYLAQLLELATNAARPAAMDFMGIGGSDVPSSENDTQLGAEQTRVYIDARTRTGNQLTFTATFFPGEGSGYFSELGIFNTLARGQGTMLARVSTGIGIAKASTATVKVTWVITLS